MVLKTKTYDVGSSVSDVSVSDNEKEQKITKP